MNRFNAIVCSATPVRHAFVGHPVFRAWWQAILWLHGKPAVGDADGSANRETVASGFRFYAFLYAFVGLLLCFASFGLATVDVTQPAIWLCATGGILLLALVHLGKSAATEYRRGEPMGRVHLVAFVGLLLVFLTAFLVLATVAFCHAYPARPELVLGACGLLLVFGIGSYFIELLYLACDEG